MLSDAEYSKLAAAQNAENEAWNKAEPAKIDEYNKRVTEENKTAEKKKRLRTFTPREIVTTEQYKDQLGKDYRNMVAEVHGCLADLKQRFPGYKGQGY